MDRFARPMLVLVLGFGLFLASTGCRSTQPEVPPGRAYTKDGQATKAIQFSQDPRPAIAQGSAPYMQPNLSNSSDLAAGISAGPKPDGSGYGAPPASYGPPGSAGTANPAANMNLADPSTLRASTGSSAGSIPLTGTPPPGTPPINLNPLTPSGGNAGAPASGPIGSSLPDLNVPPSSLDSMQAPAPLVPSPSNTPAPLGLPSQLPGQN